MAAKKAPAKKMASTPKSPTTTTPPKPTGMQQSLPKMGSGVGKAAGVAGYEKGVLAEAAKRNQKLRKEAEQSGLGFGLINVTYRNTKGKLENSVVNRARGTAFPKEDVVYLYNKDKPKGSATGKAVSSSMSSKSKKKK